MSAPPLWQLRDRALAPGSPPLLLGIINVTPDSFSDGGRFLDTDSAVAQALRLVEQGADLLDIGGESTRPGSQPIGLDEELSRVIPVVRRLAAVISTPLSVDTTKAEVARQALEAGAHIINDITALQGDPAMPEVVRSYRAGVILMHMQGTPATMQAGPCYEDVVAEVVDFLEARLQACLDLGIAASQVVLDPGIGFGKTTEHNLRLLAHLEELQRLGRPVCLGVSRKGFLGKVLGRPLHQRLAGSLAAVCYALVRGTAQIVRVHDVAETRDVVVLLNKINHGLHG
ncbi:MAG TPA: dihydropteroate synthase [Gemmataceae bacterium]|nr:dihydropteroate synthase [Gemmataceae bacterium]